MLVAPASAQTRGGVMGELIKDVNEVEKKLTDLAKAMPASADDWRPGKGVRSTAETLLHIAADNYFIPALVGAAPPPETGVTKDYKTAVAFEKKAMPRDAALAELQKSFAFLRQAMNATTDAQLETQVDLFGQKNSTRGVWILATGHLHEHLGQLIAYARSNNIVPPWSK
jgi:uncharacterized damage-inducible protein DinB